MIFHFKIYKKYNLKSKSIRSYDISSNKFHENNSKSQSSFLHLNRRRPLVKIWKVNLCIELT